jgi:hypothetical protein
MPFYIKVPLSHGGYANTNGQIESVQSRAHASELLYGDAAHAKGLADRMWPEIVWRIEHARTGRFIVKGDLK